MPNIIHRTIASLGFQTDLELTTKSIQSHISSLSKVKTIWNLDAPIELETFYTPTNNAFSTSSDTATTLDAKTLESDRRLLVEGTAGQGKSILLRHMAIQSPKYINKIPVFIELRRAQNTPTPVDDLIREQISNWGCNDSNKSKFMAEDAALFLDAIDEAPAALTSRILTEIDGFSKTFPDLPIVISSRPGHGAESLALFRRYMLGPISIAAVEEIIRKTVSIDEQQELLTNYVRSPSQHLSGLLKTPLMVALLTLHFRIDRTLPENQIEFFDNLASLLLARHDVLKAGYRRPRASTIPDRTMIMAFDALCYLTKKEDVSFGDIDSFVRSMKTAIDTLDEATDYSGQHEKALDDITRVTCLLVREGNHLSFVHKTVQEFHAARFIAKSDEVRSSHFYEAMRGGRWPSWSNVLYFLQHLDRYKYSKHFLMPMIARSLGESPNEWKFSISWLIQRVGDVELVFAARSSKSESWPSSISIKTPATRADPWIVHEKQLFRRLFSAWRPEFPEADWRTEDLSVTFENVINSPPDGHTFLMLRDAVLSSVREIGDEMVAQAAEATRFMEDRERATRELMW